MRYIILGFLSLLSLSVMAEDGTKLLRSCESLISLETVSSLTTEKAFYSGECLGVIRASRRIIGAMEEGAICIPPRSTHMQVAKVFTRYANDRPEQLHKDGIVLFLQSLRVSFPCGN